MIRITDSKPNTETLSNLLNEIQPFAEKHRLTISKPDKFKAGTISTLAIIQNAFTVDNDGNIEREKFLLTLRKLEQMIDDYGRNEKTQNKIKMISELKTEFQKVKSMKNEVIKKQEFEKAAVLHEKSDELSKLIGKVRMGQ